jgi:predicted GNAT superfamily acetyltransferase
MHDRFSAQSGEAEAAPIVNSHVDGKGQVRPAERPLPDAPGIRIEIHPDIQSLKHAVPDEAMAWREVTRRAFLYYLSIQYTVTGFYRDRNTGRCYYNLKQS